MKTTKEKINYCGETLTVNVPVDYKVITGGDVKAGDKYYVKSEKKFKLIEDEYVGDPRWETLHSNKKKSI